jgi:hypothetical protein
VIDRRVPESKPLFMWVTYHAPHGGGPKEPDDPKGIGTVNTGPYRDLFAAEPLPSMSSFNEADVSDKPIGIRNRPQLTPRKIAAIREAYQQQLESLLSVDDGVKAIVDALRAKGELDNTLLVFTDDNGFFHGQHRVPSGKVLLYEPSIRVPLLMRGPGVPKDRHLAQMTANIDLAPTVMDAANAQAGRVMDGKSLLPLPRASHDAVGTRPADRARADGREARREGDGRDRRRRQRKPGQDRSAGDRQFVAIRTPKFLYAEYANRREGAVRPGRDPDELTNVAGLAGYSSIQGELAARLAKLKDCAGAACKVGPSVSLARTKCKFHVSGADKRYVTSASFSRKGRTVTARISFDDGRVVLARASCRSAASTYTPGRGRDGRARGLEWDTPLFPDGAHPVRTGAAVRERPRCGGRAAPLPERATMVSMPVQMDDDSWVVLPGYRVQHSSVLGPTKGGIRYDPHVTLGECAALAMWMTWKCALLRPSVRRGQGRRPLQPARAVAAPSSSG